MKSSSAAGFGLLRFSSVAFEDGFDEIAERVLRDRGAAGALRESCGSPQQSRACGAYFPQRSIRVEAISLGVSETATPHSARIFFFAAAVSSSPPTMAQIGRAHV